MKQRPSPKEVPATKHLSERFESRLKFETTVSDRIADFFTGWIGTIAFLFTNALFFFVWLLANTHVLPLIPFDPFPFSLLTTIVSLEAIFLSTIVLISQNRQGRIADVRQQMDFEIDVRGEEKADRILDMLDQVHDHFGLQDPDEKMEKEKVKPDLKAIQQQIERDLDQ